MTRLLVNWKSRTTGWRLSEPLERDAAAELAARLTRDPDVEIVQVDTEGRR